MAADKNSNPVNANIEKNIIQVTNQDGNIVDVTQQVTKTVEVASRGPQGPVGPKGDKGEPGDIGSFTNLNVPGNITASQDISASGNIYATNFIGTASLALYADNASLADTANIAFNALGANTASVAINAINAETASYIEQAEFAKSIPQKPAGLLGVSEPILYNLVISPTEAAPQAGEIILVETPLTPGLSTLLISTQSANSIDMAPGGFENNRFFFNEVGTLFTLKETGSGIFKKGRINEARPEPTNDSFRYIFDSNIVISSGSLNNGDVVEFTHDVSAKIGNLYRPNLPIQKIAYPNYNYIDIFQTSSWTTNNEQIFLDPTISTGSVPLREDISILAALPYSANLTLNEVTASVFTGSLEGTASYSTNALSASYSTNALSASQATSASYSTNALSASQATSASYATFSNSSTFALGAAQAIVANSANSILVDQTSQNNTYGFIFADTNAEAPQALYMDSQIDTPSWNPSSNLLISPNISASSTLFAQTLSLPGILNVSSSIAEKEVLGSSTIDITNGIISIKDPSNLSSTSTLTSSDKFLLWDDSLGGWAYVVPSILYPIAGSGISVSGRNISIDPDFIINFSTITSTTLNEDTLVVHTEEGARQITPQNLLNQLPLLNTPQDIEFLAITASGISSSNNITAPFFIGNLLGTASLSTNSLLTQTASYIEASNINQPFSTLSASLLSLDGIPDVSASIAAAAESGGTFEGGFDVDLEIQNITASQTISASQFIGDLTGTASIAQTALSINANNITQPFSSLTINGAITQSGGDIILLGIKNQTDPQDHVVTFDNTTGKLYITASTAFGGGSTTTVAPGGNSTEIQFNNAGVLEGAKSFFYDSTGDTSVILDGNLLLKNLNVSQSIFTLTNATSSYIALSNLDPFIITASTEGQTITFTKGDSSTFNITIDTGSHYTDSDVVNVLNTQQVVSGSASEVRTFLNVADGATNTPNPAISNISGTPSLTSGITAGEIRSLIGVDPSGTDNSINVTLTGDHDYITISGQQITRHSIDLATDVTGVLQVSEGGTGLTSISGLLNSNVTKTSLGLNNVTNDAQLKIASNLSDLNSVVTARNNLGLGNGNNVSFLTVNASSFTGSLQGTAQTASYVETAQTASYVILAQTASYVETAQTASYIEASNINQPFTNLSASLLSIDGIPNVSASIAAAAESGGSTGSGDAFPYEGDATITGSLTITGDFNTGGNITNVANISSSENSLGVHQGIFFNPDGNNHSILLRPGYTPPTTGNTYHFTTSSFFPGNNNTINLGSSTKYFNTLYINDIIALEDVDIDGNLGIGGIPNVSASIAAAAQSGGGTPTDVFPYEGDAVITGSLTVSGGLDLVSGSTISGISNITSRVGSTITQGIFFNKQYNDIIYIYPSTTRSDYILFTGASIRPNRGGAFDLGEPANVDLGIPAAPFKTLYITNITASGALINGSLSIEGIPNVSASIAEATLSGGGGFTPSLTTDLEARYITASIVSASQFTGSLYGIASTASYIDPSNIGEDFSASIQTSINFINSSYTSLSNANNLKLSSTQTSSGFNTLNILGDLSSSGDVYLTGLQNQTTPQNHVVTFDNTTGRLYITASTAFGGGTVTGGSPEGPNNSLQFNNAGAFGGSPNLLFTNNNLVLTGSLLVDGNIEATSFTGSLQGTASYVETAQTASYVYLSDVDLDPTDTVIRDQFKNKIGLGPTSNPQFSSVEAPYGYFNIITSTPLGGGTIIWANYISASSYISASTFIGDGSQLTGIGSNPFPFIGNPEITGSLSVTGNIIAGNNITASGALINGILSINGIPNVSASIAEAAQSGGDLTLGSTTDIEVRHITASNISASGDLSINGILNVSASIAEAARNGNEVSLDLNTDIEVRDITASGEINATSFVGDGSQLTGIGSNPFPFEGNAVITGSLEITEELIVPELALNGVGIPTIESPTNIILSASNAVIIKNAPLQLESFTNAEVSNLPLTDGFIFYNSDQLTFQGIYGGGVFNIGEGGENGSFNPSFTTDLEIRNITTSQNISSSGYISASSFVGNLLGTAQTASYVLASNVIGKVPQANIADIATVANSINASNISGIVENAQTASYVENAQTASYVENAQTASYANLAQTASYIETAQTASYVETAQTASYVETAQTASYVETAQTASYVETAQTASYVETAQTASYININSPLQLYKVTTSEELDNLSLSNGEIYYDDVNDKYKGKANFSDISFPTVSTGGFLKGVTTVQSTFGQFSLISPSGSTLFITATTLSSNLISSNFISASSYVSASVFVGNLIGTAQTASYIEASNINQPFTNLSASILSIDGIPDVSASIALAAQTGTGDGGGGGGFTPTLYNDLEARHITASGFISSSELETTNLTTLGNVQLKNITDNTPQDHILTYNVTSGQVYVTSSNAFGFGGGGSGVPGGSSFTVQYNQVGVLTGSDAFKVAENDNNIDLTVTGSITATNEIYADDFILTGLGMPTITSDTNLILSASNAVEIRSSFLRLRPTTTGSAEVNGASPGDIVYDSEQGKFFGKTSAGWVAFH